MAPSGVHVGRGVVVVLSSPSWSLPASAARYAGPPGAPMSRARRRTLDSTDRTSEGPWPGWRPIRRRPGRVQWVRASKASWVAIRRATRAPIECIRLRPLALSGRTYVARMVGWVCQVVVVERAAHSDTSCARWRPRHLTRQATESIIVIRRPVPLTHTLRFDAFTS